MTFAQLCAQYPEITQVVSQMGRPDDGTDVSTFNNVEFLADLKPSAQWRPQFHGSKDELIAAIQNDFKQYPGNRLQLLAEHSGQRRGGDVRRQG